MLCGTAKAEDGQMILLELDDGRLVQMFCQEGVGQYEDLDSVPAIQVEQEWTLVNPTCKHECEKYRGWIVGEYLCLELYIPRNLI